MRIWKFGLTYWINLCETKNAPISLIYKYVKIQGLGSDVPKAIQKTY